MHAQMKRFVDYMIENTMGKGENATSQHFLLFPECFQKAFSSGLLAARMAQC